MRDPTSIDFPLYEVLLVELKSEQNLNIKLESLILAQDERWRQA